MGPLALGAVKPATIRAWRRRFIDGGTPEPQAVKAYALLRAIFNTAMKEDEIIRQNPCWISGYDRYHTPERPAASIAQVFALADAMPVHFSALVVVAELSGLRWGELAALRRRDVDLDAALVRVPRKLAVLNGRVEFGSPKSAAGVRVVALPAAAVEALKPHLAVFVDDHPDALIFTGAKGRVLRSSSFGKAAGWRGAVASVGLTDLHLHDLRHTGNTLAAVPVYLALVKLALVKKVGGKKQGDRPEA